MNQAIKQFKAIWGKLGVNQKATIILILVAFAVGLGVLVHLSGRPSYELLYSDLDEKDMAAVASYLKESKVPYRIAAGGKAIMVPEGTKYDLRLGLASKGIIPGGHVGLELWNAPGWGASPMAEQLMKRRAIQGELARTISHIEQIAWADVQIAQAEQSLFAEDQRPTTAAVTLKLHPGRTLSASQVAGICRLVACSVEGLDPKNVTIIDDQGNLLTQPHGDPAVSEAAGIHSYRRAYEDYLASKAQGMLDRALGPNRSVVKVSATLDMNQSSETHEEFDPARRVAKTEKTLSKSVSAGEGGAAGAGAQSEELSETAFEVAKVVRTIHTAPGAVKKLDVAVVVDPSYLDKDGKEATLTPQQLEELGTLVKRAVGFDETGTRKDSFQLTAMPFRKRPETAADAPAREIDKHRYTMQVVRYGSAALAAMVFVGFAGLTLRRALRSAPGPAGGPAPVMEAEMLSLGGGNGQAQIRNRVKELIARDPTAAARIIQRWINEEDIARRGKTNG